MIRMAGFGKLGSFVDPDPIQPHKIQCLGQKVSWVSSTFGTLAIRYRLVRVMLNLFGFSSNKFMKWHVRYMP